MKDEKYSRDGKKILCHYGFCELKSTHGFKSEKGRVQNERYCYEHAKEVRSNGVFSRCKLFKFSSYRRNKTPLKERILSEMVNQNLDEEKEEYLDTIKPLIKK